MRRENQLIDQKHQKRMIMQFQIKKTILFGLAILSLGLFSCELSEIPDPNNPSLELIEENATIGEMQNLVDGIESWIRDRHATYFDGVGMIGREYYRFSNSDPRFTSDLLGKGSAVLDNNTFYTTRPFESRYRVIKNANILITAIENTSATVTPEQVSSTLGYAKTIKAHELLMVLNQQYNNGVRVDVADPDNLGPFLGYDASLDAIKALLDEAREDLNKGGSEFFFSLTSGYADPSVAGFIEFNRALAARVDAYREDWAGVLANLEASFFDMNGDLNLGVYNVFSTAGGDQLNEMWYPPNATGELRVAHPSFLEDIRTGDTRISKVRQRDETANLDDLSSDYDVNVYAGNTSSIARIRNEELILLYAEARIQNDEFDEAVTALDVIRNAYSLGNYSGDRNRDALLDELLYQRRYSLYGEGHRWIDMRRYSRLGELPIDRAGDDVWEQFPRPMTENEG